MDLRVMFFTDFWTWLLESTEACIAVRSTTTSEQWSEDK